MQLYSMTGFGRGEAGNDDYVVTAEIKSVNHRFKDIRFKMSSIYNSIEIDMKKKLNENFKRGSFDIYLNFKRSETKSKFDDIDPKKVSSFLETLSKSLEAGGFQKMVQPTEFLRSEFMKDKDLGKDETLMTLTLEAFDGALTKLKESRSGEGEKLKAVILDHRKTYFEHFSTIDGHSESFQVAVEEKLKKRFEEYSTELKIDEPRFLQEVVYYLEKMDVHEETNRIKAHLSKFDSIIEEGGEVGRQIDFLIQELNRETNTIGSKSSMKEISDNVVQMKVQLEKIREQGLNLE